MSTTMTHQESQHCDTTNDCDTPVTEEQSATMTKPTLRPKADIYEAGDAWFLVLEMPGVDESGTDVSIEKNVLTITGDVDAFDTEGFDRHYGEFAARRFERSFRLPEDVDASAIEANVKSGVLRLRLPKAATALPQKVVVNAG